MQFFTETPITSFEAKRERQAQEPSSSRRPQAP